MHAELETVRLLIVLGTRPEAVKLLAVIRELRRDPRIDLRIVSTGQHRDLVRQILDPFGIEPDADLKILQAGQGLNDIVARAVPLLDVLLESIAPRLVLVQGDTTSAFCAALAAFHRGIPVAHVEAGLRRGDRFRPDPEEVHRRMITCTADLHLAPTRSAAANLLREGVPRRSIVVTGNTVVDALLAALDHTGGLGAGLAARRETGPRPRVLVTLHRRESWQPPVRGAVPALLAVVLSALRAVGREHPVVEFVLPVHPDPDVRALVDSLVGDDPHIQRSEPLGYFDLVREMARASIVVTDSDDVQAEAPTLGVPVLVVRNTTEQPEGIDAGTSRVVGLEPAALREALEELIVAPRPLPDRVPCPNPFGDGQAARRVREAILHYFRLAPAPEEFSYGVDQPAPVPSPRVRRTDAGRKTA